MAQPLKTPQESAPAFVNLEDVINYEETIDNKFNDMFKDRKLLATDKYRSKDIVMDDFPGWNVTVIERMKSTFAVFDVGGDGLVDFEELCEILDEFGDANSEEERKFHFDIADSDKSGSLDFEAFLIMMYNLTMKTAKPSEVAGPSTGSNVIRSTTTTITSTNTIKSANITTKSGASADSEGEKDLDLTPLGDSLRKIDRNMTRLRGLDVVQQLEAGVF